jgi:hypothetical protein
MIPTIRSLRVGELWIISMVIPQAFPVQSMIQHFDCTTFCCPSQIATKELEVYTKVLRWRVSVVRPRPRVRLSTDTGPSPVLHSSWELSPAPSAPITPPFSSPSAAATLSTETSYQQDVINRERSSTRLIVGMLGQGMRCCKLGQGMRCCKCISTSTALVCETQRKVHMYGCVSEWVGSVCACVRVY